MAGLAGTGQVVASRFAAGDEDAARTIYQVYRRLVFVVAYRVLGDRALAEEASQQAFLQAWRASASYQPSKAIGPWLAAIARRAAACRAIRASMAAGSTTRAAR